MAALCLVPLSVSFRTLDDPFGQTEEAVNAAVWAVAGRNIRDQGWVASRFGALYTPLFTASQGIYAHHPPLPVWLSRLWLGLGTREFIPRLLALLLAAISLALLHGVLRLYVPRNAALWTLGATATTVYLLRDGRLFTTLTIATPLFVAALRTVLLRIHFGRAWQFSLFMLVPLLIASSWDGVAGAGVLCTVLIAYEAAAAWRERRMTAPLLRALAVGVLAVGCLGLLTLYFINAQGSLAELLRQARVRSGGSELGIGEWLRGQLHFLGLGLGPLGAGILLGVPLWMLLRQRSSLLGALALSAAPGLAMTVLMREGAQFHAFWAYNLVLPYAFAVAQAMCWATKHTHALGVLRAALVLEAASNVGLTGALLEEEHRLNGLGALVRTYYGAHYTERVAVYGAYDFHPYIAWYLHVPHTMATTRAEVAERLRTGAWSADTEALVDTLHLGCTPTPSLAHSESGRWVVAHVGDIVTCAPR